MLPEPSRAELARELLRYKMEEYSEDFFCASWLVDLETVLWKLAVSPPEEHKSPKERAFFQHLHHLALIADGWWVWQTAAPPEPSGPVFISLPEWHASLDRT